jgi:predicted Zn-dependent peptidase
MMLQRIQIKTLALVALALIVAQSTFAQDPRSIVAPELNLTTPTPEQFTLDNGLQVVFLASTELPVVRMTMLFPGGSAYETDDLCGVGEITARLIRSGGAGNLSGAQIDEQLDFLGASISSSASGDNHRLDLRCLTKGFGVVLNLFTKILTEPTFDSAKLALEKSNKSDAIRRQFDSPTGATRTLFYQTVYGGKLYGRYPTLASVDAISDEVVRYTYNKVYTPSQGVLAVSGDLSRAMLEVILQNSIGSWTGTKILERPVPQGPTAAELPQAGVYYAYKDINQSSIRLGHLTELFDSPDRYAVRIMNYVVGVGFAGRLTAKIRSEAGLAYSVGGYFVNRQTFGSYFAYCQTKADATGKSLQMILDILSEAKQTGITEEEFARAKESILNSFVFEYETPHQVAESVAENIFYGFPADQTTLDLAALKAVTLADCNRVAREQYRPEDFRIVVVGDTAQMDQKLSDFGNVTTLSLEAK